jgi:indole-3-acetate monooxygenase
LYSNAYDEESVVRMPRKADMSVDSDAEVPDFPGRAWALAEKIEARVDDAAAAATLTPDVVDALEAGDFFRMGLPRGLGGYELDPATQVRTMETLAHTDGSTAWAVAIGNSSSFFAWLDQSAALGLLDGRPSMPVSAVFAPTARGVEVDGGYRVSGRWNWASGSPHAALFVMGFAIVDEDGQPRAAGDQPLQRWGVFPASEVEVQSNWSGAVGLRASGSHSVVIDDKFVPYENTIMPYREAPVAEGALYRLPFSTLARSALIGIPLGLGRRALDELNSLCRTKTRDSVLVALNSDVQIRLAKAEAALRASRSFLLDVTERTFAVAADGQEVPLQLRAEYTLASQMAMSSSVGAADLAFEIAGASAATAGDAIQRCWRDVNVASQHILFGRNRWRGAGAAVLGVPVDPLYV